MRCLFLVLFLVLFVTPAFGQNRIQYEGMIFDSNQTQWLKAAISLGYFPQGTTVKKKQITLPDGEKINIKKAHKQALRSLLKDPRATPMAWFKAMVKLGYLPADTPYFEDYAQGEAFVSLIGQDGAQMEVSLNWVRENFLAKKH